MTKITRHLMLTSATFAAAGAANKRTVSTEPPAAGTATKPDRKKAGPKVEPKLAEVRNDIPLPDGATNRGSRSKYDFDKLAVGQSFGVMNKAAADMSSIVSNQNRKVAKDAAGNEIMVDDTTKPVHDAAGAVVGYAKMPKPMPKFLVRDVDPATDPDGAKSRVWRTA